MDAYVSCVGCNERMLLAMDWTGRAAFNDKPLRPWDVDEEIAGMTRTEGALTFLTLDRAGHMVRWLDRYLRGGCVLTAYMQVPHDQPKNSLEMLTRWLKGEDM